MGDYDEETDGEEGSDDQEASPLPETKKSAAKGRKAASSTAKGKKVAAASKDEEGGSSTQRKVQNRIAQREFRLRKQQYIRDLESRVELLSNSSSSEAYDHLREILRAMVEENRQLRKLIEDMGKFFGENLGGVVGRMGMDVDAWDKIINKRETDTAYEVYQRRKEVLSQEASANGNPSPSHIFPSSSSAAPASGNAKRKYDAINSLTLGSNSGKKSKMGGGAGLLERNFSHSPGNNDRPHTGRESSAGISDSGGGGGRNNSVSDFLSNQYSVSLASNQEQQQPPQNAFPSTTSHFSTQGILSTTGSGPNNSGQNDFSFSPLPGIDSFNDSYFIRSGTQDTPQSDTKTKHTPNSPASAPSPLTSLLAVTRQHQEAVSAVTRGGSSETPPPPPVPTETHQNLPLVYTMEEVDPTSAAEQLLRTRGVKSFTDKNANPKKQEAFQLIGYHLNHYRNNPNYHLPPSLIPTLIQRTVPHDHVVDGLPFPTMRDRMILFRDRFKLVDAIAGLLEGFAIHGDDVLSHVNWEISYDWMMQFPMLIDDTTLACSNRWRVNRGEREITKAELEAKIAEMGQMPIGIEASNPFAT